MTREIKTVSVTEIRFTDDQSGTFTGYASVFGEPDSFGDTIKAGAFKKTLSTRSKTGGPAMLWQHNPDEPIGAWLDMVEDSKGLKVTGKLAETQRGKDALILLKANAINGLSIGFRTRASERGPNGGRVLTEIELVEISLVTLPAATKARVTSVKSVGQAAGLAAISQAARRAATAIKGRAL